MSSGTSLTRVLIPAVVTVSSIKAVSFASTGTASVADCAPTTTFVGTDTVLKFTSVGTCTWNVPADR